MEIDYSNVEIFGEADESGRPANVPEKFWRGPEGETPAGADWGSVLKSHNYLEQKLGASAELIGAPEAYEIPEVNDLPVDYKLAPDDPLVGWFQGYAKEKNLSQSAFNGIVAGYVQQRAAEVAAQKEAMKAELDALGPNGKGQELIKTFVQRAENWMKDLPEAQRTELMQGLNDAIPSAAAYKFLDFMAAKMQPAHLPSGQEVAAPDNSLEKIRAMQTEVYADGPLKGKRKYEVDPAHRAKVEALRKQILGDAEYQRVVG